MAFTFERLDVWMKARVLVKDVYGLMDQFPCTEKYSLCDQLRRAVVSVPSNIAEGSSRMSSKEKIRFAEIAYGSLMETFCQLQLAADLNYISRESVDTLRPRFEEISRMLSGFRKALLARD